MSSKTSLLMHSILNDCCCLGGGVLGTRAASNPQSHRKERAGRMEPRARLEGMPITSTRTPLPSHRTTLICKESWAPSVT